MLKNGVFLQNRYEIINCIGSGGMADVYKARDHKLNRFVAVKILKPDFRDDKEFVSKFRVEAQAAAGLAHPNIVNVYDVGEDRGVNFIVMEMVEGITVKAYIAKKGRLSVRETTSIALQAAAGLEAAHNNGIIHRDVKPQNIIISLDGKAKIADFGIARAASSDTISQSAMGSVHYSAPEQTRGGYSDAKSDIYALGVSMFEMLTGRLPFDGDTTVEVALKHLQEDVPTVRQYCPEIPYSTEQIVLRCMQKSPDRRYQNMSELIRDLRESLVNPEGDFVTIPTVDRKAHTVLLTKEEMKQIQNGGKLPTYNNDIDTGVAAGIGAMGAAEGTTAHGSGYTAGGNGSYYHNSRYQNRAGSAARNSHYDLEQDTSLGAYQRKMDYPPEDEADLDIPDYERQLREAREGEEEEAASRRRRIRRHNQERGSEHLVTVIAGVLAFVSIVFLLFSLARGMGWFGLGSTTPKETEKTEQAATEAPVKWEVNVVPANTAAGTGNTTTATDLKVPDLSDSDQESAQKTLEDMGLLVSVDNTRYSDTVAAGNVITTNPGEGSSVKAGDTVTIYVSQGEDSSTVEVPELVNHYESDARTLLSSLGLYVYTTEEYSQTAEAGMVIAQDIEAGTKVATGTAVTITVSLGQENTTG